MRDQYVHCINCGESTYVPMWNGSLLDYTEERVYQVKKCNRCGLARTFPFPEKDQIAVSYGRGAYNPAKKLCAKALEALARISERSKLRRLSHLTQGRTLLDVGSGKGRFVHAANDQGWNAYGYEPFQEARVPQKYLDRFFTDHPLDDLPLKEGSVDVVTMWHVLEHIPDPLATLRSVRRYLKNDGVLLVAVPNIQGVLAKLARGKWYHLDVPRHLWHFSTKSLSTILVSAGYEVTGTSYPSNQNLISLWMSIGNMMGCAHNYPWNILRLNRNMLRNVSILCLVYSTIVHTLLFICLPVLYLISRVLCFRRQSDTFEIYARKISNE
jgi:2-polyprenyl-3-methyl-5-hydroxy-6-metoxy-1,4-benzoquinol methylase